MRTLLERLRDDSWQDEYGAANLNFAELQVWHLTCCEAADEIERLRGIVACGTELALVVSRAFATGSPLDRDVLRHWANKYHDMRRAAEAAAGSE